PVYLEYMPLEDNVFLAEEQPLPIAATPTTDSPRYIPEFDPKGDLEEDDEEDLEEDPADYPVDSTVVSLPVVDHVAFCFPTPSQEVRKSSTAGAARQDEPAVAMDNPYSLVREELYGFVDMVDVALRHSMSKELGYGITDTWDELVGANEEIAPTTLQGVNQRVTNLSTIVKHETTIMYGMMEDAQDDRSQLRGRVNLFYKDRHVHHRLAVMIEREARMAREAWGLSMDASDNAHSDVMRHGVIKELLSADHKRQVQLTKALRLLKGLPTQMIELQKHHGPVKGLAQPDAPGEAESIDLLFCLATQYRPFVQVNGTDVVAYSQRFQELALTCDRMFSEENDKVERYIDGLPNTIHGSVMPTKPKTMQDAIKFATELMNKKINTWAERQADNKRKSDDTTRNNHQQPNKRQNTRRAYAAGNGDRRAYEGPRPLCTKCNYQHDGPCAPKCHKGISRRNVQKLKNNNNRGNQVGNAKAQAKVYAVDKAGANLDNNVIT
nr:hypothetical protein [Tanacetum cinerariifolium]